MKNKYTTQTVINQILLHVFLYFFIRQSNAQSVKKNFSKNLFI